MRTVVRLDRTVGQVLALLLTAMAVAGCDAPHRGGEAPPLYDVLLRDGVIYDGTGAPPTTGDIAINGDRVVAVGPALAGRGRREIEVGGLAVAPGFINLLSWSGEALIEDGRGQGALRQGVTLEVMGEGVSMGPLNAEMKASLRQRQGDIQYDIEWTSLGEYLDFLEQRGVSVNVASYLGAATARWNVLGTDNVEPTSAQLEAMRELVREAMEEGAMGVASSLIYAPGVYAGTEELVALVRQAGACGGIYATHMRSEGDRFIEAIEESMEIARRSDTPLHIFHLKVGGRDNWPKMESALAMIERSREEGLRITADMYPYVASGTGLSASMPPWVQVGGHEAWMARLADPLIRARVVADMQDPDPDWENVMLMAGGSEHVLLADFKKPALQALAGMTLAEVARERGISAEEAAIELVLEDDSRVGVIYFTMSEANLERQLVRPWMSIASDGVAMSTEGVFLNNATHPRSYGSFARVFAHYVRDQGLLDVAEAVHKVSGLPAAILGLQDRGRLAPGYVADVVVFDPASIQDHASYIDSHQYATGVTTVLVNGVEALRDGEPTAARPGRAVRGRGWTGWPEGGCRASAASWDWAGAPSARP